MSTEEKNKTEGFKDLPRELKRHYISATDEDIREMLDSLGMKSFDDLYEHIPSKYRFSKAPKFADEYEYEDLKSHLKDIAAQNNLPTQSFIGDGLAVYRSMGIVPYVSALRGLTTAYTPYQPERSQGTLLSHWIYQSLLQKITGFEAVNASMYDRSTALFEALNTARRLVKKGKNTCLVFSSIYPGDAEVLKTQSIETDLNIEWIDVNPTSGRVDIEALRSLMQSLEYELAGVAFPQVNHFGNLEEVDQITDLCKEAGVKAIAIVDPFHLATGGLKAPADFGAGGEGADIFVAEGQHLAIDPTYGGPGLGVFGIRRNEKCKNDIRSAPGRFIGEAKDISGRVCKTLVISTREQHIRREKATSNICSNQAFLATIAGASLLERGEDGFKEASRRGRSFAKRIASKLSAFEGVSLRFPETPFYNSLTVSLDVKASELIESARLDGIHLGVDVSKRLPTRGQLLQLSFSDVHDEESLEVLLKFFKKQMGNPAPRGEIPAKIPDNLLRVGKVGLPTVKLEKLKKYYSKLSEQNISPDDSIYPLGSCTMKYNPHINDEMAALPGYRGLHPQCPPADAQGNLQIIYETQEIFKSILGLPALTTQPLAGAQGELMGLKMIQAYHRDHSKNPRDIILIPRSAHGTNPASAATAGYSTGGRGSDDGIVLIEADESGQIDMEQFKSTVKEYSNRIAGIMVTNPNTSGIFESNFAEVAAAIHQVGGLVYMDGANLNAIAGWLNLGSLGVDAVHSNTHKTWSIPHGGGGPGDAFVAVSNKLAPYLPGHQVEFKDGIYSLVKTDKSIGSCHRHLGNFGHKVRCYTYLGRLGTEGVRRMSAVAVLSARYLHKRLSALYPGLPQDSSSPRMHEFILTLSKETFSLAEKAGLLHSEVIPRLGKLFLDFGFHAPTVAFPEIYGIMIEPTETYSLSELKRFAEAVEAIHQLVTEKPEVLLTVPHFTPVDRVDDVAANRNLVLGESLDKLPEIYENRVALREIEGMSISEISQKIIEVHSSIKKS